MPNLILPPGWRGREQDVTDFSLYTNRRQFVRSLGLGSIGLLLMGSAPACSGAKVVPKDAPPPDGPLDAIPANAPREGLPAPRNAQFAVPERPMTDRILSASYNNFYEFKHQGNLKELWHLTGAYEPFPMTLKVKGLVEEELTLDIGDLIREMDLEERVYRFRCVEAWAITVPWTGFPLRKLIERCKPLSSATHVRFVSANVPSEMPGIVSGSWYPWPYFEGLRMDEAMNELAFVATGLYGEPLPKQNGSPIRMVLPWKYGYKGAKAINEIEFVDKEPKTFWNDLAPNEYPFLSNVNPNVPHPRWSQASERLLITNDDVRRVPTMMFNGYTEWVGDLYPEEPRG